jgi:hypothetical protein
MGGFLDNRIEAIKESIYVIALDLCKRILKMEILPL